MPIISSMTIVWYCKLPGNKRNLLPLLKKFYHRVRFGLVWRVQKGAYAIINCLSSAVCCYCRRRHCHCLLAAFLRTYRQSSSSPLDLFLGPTHVVCVKVMVSVVFVCLSNGGVVPMLQTTLGTSHDPGSHFITLGLASPSSTCHYQMGQSPRTCSNLFTWSPTHPSPTSD